MKKIILVSICLSLPYFPQAVDMSIKHTTYKDVPHEKTFFIDQYGSMHAGASLLLSSRSLLGDAENYLLPQKIKQNFWWNAGLMGVEFFLVDLPLLSFYNSFFGPGFRIRSLGGKVQSYHWGYFETDIKYSRFWPEGAYDIPLLISIASYETNQVLLQEIVFRNLRNRYLDMHIAALHAIVNFARLRHPLGSEEELSDNTFNYLHQINTKHQKREQLKPRDIKMPLLVLIPDFLLKLGVIFLQKKKGTDKLSMSDFQRQDVVYIPYLSPQYTPFGIGYSMDNYLRYKEKIFLLSLNLGKSPFYTSYYGGIGGKTNSLYTYKRYTADLVAHLWYQPKLLLEATDVLEDKNYWGGLVGIYNKFKMNSYFSLYGSILYKTVGYLEGVVAQRRFIWQAGLQITYHADVDSFYTAWNT